jgi:hypothetical protein
MIDADLDRLVKQSQNYLQSISSDLEPQVSTLLHRYMCIVISANVDKSIHLILTEYARRYGSEELKRYISKRYQRGTNYNSQRIIDTLSLFHPGWGEEFRDAIEATNLKDQIDSIYGIRNSISHGEPYNISRPSLDGYFIAHKKVIELVQKIVLH